MGPRDSSAEHSAACPTLPLPPPPQRSPGPPSGPAGAAPLRCGRCPAVHDGRPMAEAAACDAVVRVDAVVAQEFNAHHNVWVEKGAGRLQISKLPTEVGPSPPRNPQIQKLNKEYEFCVVHFF